MPSLVFLPKKRKKYTEQHVVQSTHDDWCCHFPDYYSQKRKSRAEETKKKAGKWLQKSLAFVLSEENKENVRRNQARSVLVALLFVGVQCACLNKTSITLSNIFFAFVIWRKKSIKTHTMCFFLWIYNIGEETQFSVKVFYKNKEKKKPWCSATQLLPYQASPWLNFSSYLLPFGKEVSHL